MADFELSIAELLARPGVKWHYYADDVLPAWIAEMDFRVPESVQATLENLVRQGAYGYDELTLVDSLARAYAAHMQHRFGWMIGSEQVLPVADLIQALFASVAAFSNVGDGIILQTPIYPPFLNAVRETGRSVVEHRLLDNGTRFVVDTATLRQVFSGHRLMLLCNPHNPTGRVFERSELEAIAAAALEFQTIVVADEVHAELTYPGHQHVPFASLSPEVASQTITITSATKAYNIPGLRCGILHFGSSALRERFASVFPDRMLGKVTRLGIEATIAAWRGGAVWLSSVMDTLAQNRERLSYRLRRDMPQLGFYEPEATYLAWLDCHDLQLPDSPQAYFLERARVGLTDGGEFGPTGPGHVRLNFGTSAAILEQVLDRMAAAVARLPRGAVEYSEI